jgi:hypothetical protein
MNPKHSTTRPNRATRPPRKRPGVRTHTYTQHTRLDPLFNRGDDPTIYLNTGGRVESRDRGAARVITGLGRGQSAFPREACIVIKIRHLGG